MKRTCQILAAATIALIALGAPGTASTLNLLTNGDFEQGNTGFGTDLEQAPPNISGSYMLTTNAQTFNEHFPNMGDHTTGTGILMAINGSDVQRNNVVWRASIDVERNAGYQFSGFIASLFGAPRGVLRVEINGETLGTMFAPVSIGEWVNRSFTWSSNDAVHAKIELIELSAAITGNDYALDDMAFVQKSAPEIPLPATVFLLGAAVFLPIGFGKRSNLSKA